MSTVFSSDIGSSTASQTTALDAKTDQLLKNAKTATTLSASDKLDAKTEKAGKDFESILLGSWLQGAEKSFASVPGTDEEEDDDDSSKDQFQGLAMQQLAGALTASGGIGIAKMITQHLRASVHTEQAKSAVKSTNSTPEVKTS